MSLSAKQLYQFLFACSGNWRNSIYISSQEENAAASYLLAAGRDGQPVMIPVEQFQQLTGEQIDSAECYWLETEQCQRGLAVACPKYDDLSDGAKGLAERFLGDPAHTDGEMPGYLFFIEANSSVPLFELASAMPKEQLCCEINRAALMNAICEKSRLTPVFSTG